MANIERVIKALEQCREGKDSCHGCPYDVQSAKCLFRLHSAALELLKEQETLEMRLQHACECYEELEKELNRQPKIVRCKDCKECYFASNRIPSEQTFACGKHGIDVTPDWFCADGERKEGR